MTTPTAIAKQGHPLYEENQQSQNIFSNDLALVPNDSNDPPTPLDTTLNGIFIRQRSNGDLVNYINSEWTLISKRYIDSKTSIIPQQFGALGDGVNDDSAAFQNMIDFAVSNTLNSSRNMFIPAGSYKINTIISKQLTASDLRKSGISIRGEGRNSTIILANVDNGPVFKFSAIGSGFIDGITLEDFSILPFDNTKVSDGIAIERTWLNEINRVSIKNLRGTGLKLGETTTGSPDPFAVASMKLESCDISFNTIGIQSMANNVSPDLTIINSQVSYNTQCGILYNSSYLRIINTSISRNGLSDPTNALGGIVIKSLSTAPYSSKGIVIDGVEMDTNYPVNVNIGSCTMGSIKNSSCVMVGSIFKSYGINIFPPTMFNVGGIDTTSRTWGTNFEGNRFSLVNEGADLIPFDSTNKFSFIYINQYAVGTKVDKLNLWDVGSIGAQIGTNIFFIKEDPTKNTYTDPLYFVDYDFPLGGNIGANSAALNSAFNVPYKRVFKTNKGSTRDEFAVALPTDRYFVVDATMYTSSSQSRNYGFATILANGTSGGMFSYRAQSGPTISDLNVTTVSFTYRFATATDVPTALAALVAGQMNVIATADGKIVVANKTGATWQMQLCFLTHVGDTTQNNSLILATP